MESPLLDERDRILSGIDETRSRGDTEWWQVALIVACIILGLGVLGLPYAFATMGWVLGFLVMAFSAGGAIYAGLTLHQVIPHMAKTPRGYSEIGEAAYGSLGRISVRVVQYGFLGGCLVAVQLQASKSMRIVVHEAGGSLCLAVAQVIIVLVMLPVMQVQSLGKAGKLAMIPGLLSIIIPLIIILIQLGKDGLVEPHASVGFPSDSTFKQFAHGFTTIAFAFQGQQGCVGVGSSHDRSILIGGVGWILLPRRKR